MARKKIEEEKTVTLEELIPAYGEQNTTCNALKKVVADLNTKVKAAIHSVNKENEDIIIDGWKCSLTVSEDSTLNEERVLEVAKKYKLKTIVKTKEYIDFDELEKLLYAGNVSKDILLELDACKDVTKKETLRCTKVAKEDK